MNPARRGKPSKVASNVAWLAVAGWTATLVASLAFNAWQRQRITMDAAYAEARAMLNKDISFRRWATEHGGVYVPVTARQQPVPWLAHIAERDVVTEHGVHLTLLNPATIIRQVMDRYKEEFGVRGRITGLKALNPANLADHWEAEQLHRFERGGDREVWAVTDIGGQPHLRYLRAMYMEAGCDKCHAVLGYKTGDLRGATGLSLPLTPYFARLHADYATLGVSHGLIWLFGLFGIAGVDRRARRHEAERLAQEHRVAKAELWYRTLFEQSPDGILIFDPAQRRFVDFNHKAHEALGYTREQFAGLNIVDFSPGETEAEVAARADRVMRDGHDCYETRHRKKNGEEIDVQVVIQKMSTGGVVYFLTSFRDITRQKRDEAELADYRQRLEALVGERTRDLAEKNLALEEAIRQLTEAKNHLVQSEKLASLGALVAGVAHELNTPIGNGRTVASAISELTADFAGRVAASAAGLKRSDLTGYVERMTEGAALLERNLVRAADLIHSFKQVAVDNASSLRRRFELGVMVKDVLSTLHPRLKKTPFELRVDIPPGIELDSYPGPLGQVVMNLVDNAVLHGLEERTQGHITIAARAIDQGVELCVEDDGKGIPPAIQTRIFDPFFTTRLGRGGSGLGLNIVHNLVTNVLGGSIEVVSDGVAGSRFVVRLPSRAPEAAEARPPAPG